MHEGCENIAHPFKEMQSFIEHLESFHMHSQVFARNGNLEVDKPHWNWRLYLI